ncbi:unnamed protein product [Symbiodinium necroappetens]|uniref:Uncharacterized protein n=1 Tax=Symbiodinium necroappetens TaxID=1628268 RepID=A0A812X5Z2_9DINO|nr:unnamed protein product [Symbiodinium necroappetens]
MASLVAGLFAPSAAGRGSGGGGVGDHFCCSQRRPSPPREHHFASVLTSKVHRYCDALKARREHLAAVDCFFRELIASQWRIEAIETQQKALQAEVTEDPSAVAGAEVPPSEDARLRWQISAKSCLVELVAQKDAAVAALEERASHYALAAAGADRDGGRKLCRFAAGDAERQSALQGYRRLANEVCSEACAEMSGLLEAPLDEAWLASLLKSLERRLHFWTSELEEIWALWHDATARMHNAGQDAMAAWREIAEVLESVCQHFETHGHELLIKKPELQSALVTFAARSLEVELVNSLGLSGLYGGEVSSAKQDQFCTESRLNMLTAVLDLLSHLGSLDRVGEEILSSSSATAPQQESPVMPTPTSRAAVRLASKLELCPLAKSGSEISAKPLRAEEYSESPSLRGPPGTSLESLPSAAAAVCWATAAQVTPCTALRAVASAEDLQALGNGSRSAAVLLPWLIESIVEAVCAATTPEPERSFFAIWPAPGQKMTVAALIQSCSVLGNDDFAEAVKSAAERRLHRRKNPAGDVEEAEEACGLGKTRSLQQVTRGLSSSCARLLDLDTLSEEDCELSPKRCQSRERNGNSEGRRGPE